MKRLYQKRGCFVNGIIPILRHPVERAISHYRYIHMISGHYAHKYVKENNISLGECFNHPLLRMEMSELQTRMLGWIPDRLPKLPCIEEDDNIDFAVTSSRYVFSSVDETDLERAVEHLRTQIDYGILEYPETVVALISRATGSDDIALPLLNVGNVEYQPSEAELDAIRRNNVLDLTLYDAAVAMLAPGGQDAVASDPDTPSRPYVPSDEALAAGASNFIPVSAVAEPTHHPLQCHRLGASARDVGANEPALD